MSDVRRFDHVGITVADLDSATAFFVGLGLEIEGRMSVPGEFVDAVIGIPDSLSEIVLAYVRGPEGIIVSGSSGSVDAAGGEPNRLLVRVRTGRSAFGEVGPASAPNADPCPARCGAAS